MSTVDRAGSDESGTRKLMTAPSFPARVDPWLKLVASVGALLGSAFLFFNPIGDVDLTVRIEQEVQASLPSRAVENLQLVYNGKTITRALVASIEIVNSGRRRIGADDQPWTMNLRSTDGSTVVALGEPRPTPASRRVTLAKGPTPDVAAVTFGLFNKGDKVALDLLLIDPKTDAGLPITAETNVPDLKEPVTGRRNVRERLRDAFTPPVFVVAFLALAVIIARERKELKRRNQPLAEAHKLPMGILMVTMGAAFTTLAVANGLAWIAAWFLARS